MHVIRDCGWVGGIWEGLGLEVLEDVRFEWVREWVEEVMRGASEIEWETLVVGCWAIWERRNKVVFEGEQWCEAEVLDRVRSITWEMREEGTNTVTGKEGEGARDGSRNLRAESGQEGVCRRVTDGSRNLGAESGHERVCKRAGWRRPGSGFAKINVDAGIREGFGVAWEVVCRNEQGKVEWGVTVQQSGDGDPTVLEAEAVLLGLEEAKGAGIKKIIVESDCKIVVEDLKKCRRGRTEIYAIYEAIWKLESCFDVIHFTFANRNYNKVAHELAHVTPWLIGRRVWYTDLP